ncbi:terminal uridylyltransferase Tailor-like [Anticarsia gemmatalis]|uniref:terminal uridylyltransferase Tailor-like n=1 Tax=Anticarsia gemmatalis TaxID=129554 RepID=UPI003F7574A7
MLTQAEIANLSVVFRDFQQTLQTRWPGSEVFPLGSFVTELASRTSDADCMVRVPQHDVTTARYLVLHTARLLLQQPALYHTVRAKVDPTRRIPLLKFTYLPTNTNCDVNFISNLALENSRMMGYYFSLNDKFLHLAAILKYWSKIHRLRSSDTLASNSLNLLIIFYLQQRNMAPPFTLLQRHTNCPVNNWETSFKRIFFNTTNSATLYELLGGFFKYYSEFNFEEYVVSPLLGRPIRKQQFRNVDSLPEELFLYKNYMRKPGSKPLTFNTKLCVQDVIEQRRNTADVPDTKANRFITHVKLAAALFDILSKDRVLRILLAQYRIGETMSLKYCVNATRLHYINKLQ